MRIFYETILEALFPLSPAEKELFSYSPDQALALLPPAPGYTGLAVPLPEGRSLFAYKDVRVEKLIWNIKYKKSAQAVKIGSFSLFQWLINMDDREFGNKVSLDTPSKLASFAASSRAGRAPKCPSNAVPPSPYLLIIPIPITKQRRRERGYNQCELLTNEIQRLYLKEKNEAENNVRVEFLFENNLLVRTHHDGRHTLKDRKGRVESAQGIFGVDEKIAKQVTKNLVVIIIDDVITTGSTMREAIDTIKGAGFADVKGLSLAH